MPKPTIDEMLQFLDRTHMNYHDKETEESKAIRAILEQHRTAMLEWKRPTELEMIRAFVERVEKRRLEMDQYATEEQWWKDAIYSELAALEAEVKE